MFTIYVKIDNDWKQISIDDYLAIAVKYHWIDLIRLSIEDNISIKRMIDKLIKSGGLIEIDDYSKKIVLRYIDVELQKIRYQ